MSDLYVVYSFLSAFFQTVIIGCTNPANWEHCFPVSDWFVPWLHDATHVIMEEPYAKERCSLKNLQPSKEGS